MQFEYDHFLYLKHSWPDIAWWPSSGRRSSFLWQLFPLHSCSYNWEDFAHTSNPNVCHEPNCNITIQKFHFFISYPSLWWSPFKVLETVSPEYCPVHFFFLGHCFLFDIFLRGLWDRLGRAFTGLHHWWRPDWWQLVTRRRILLVVVPQLWSFFSRKVCLAPSLAICFKGFNDKTVQFFLSPPPTPNPPNAEIIFFKKIIICYLSWVQVSCTKARNQLIKINCAWENVVGKTFPSSFEN